MWLITYTNFISSPIAEPPVKIELKHEEGGVCSFHFYGSYILSNFVHPLKLFIVILEPK